MARTKQAAPRNLLVDWLNRVVMFIAVLAAVSLVSHVFFVLFEANPENAIVAVTRNSANVFVLWFRDLFVPETLKLRTLINYGIAASAWLIVGRLLVGLFRTVARDA